MTHELLKKIRATQWIQQKFFLSDVAGRFFGRIGSGHLILSTIPFASTRVMQLRSKAENLAAVSTFLVNGRTLGLASVQLDYGQDENPIRRDQLMLVMAMLKKLECSDMILAGDFGANDLFSDIVDVDYAKRFCDLWTCTFPPSLSPVPAPSADDRRDGGRKYVAIVPESKKPLPAVALPKETKEVLSRLGFTVDAKENSLLRKLHPEVISGRYDRILVCSEGLFWDRLMGIRMFGKVLIEGSKDMYPSTHFGITAKIASSEMTEPAEESTCVIS